MRGSLFRKHWLALMGDQKVVHVAGVLLLDSQDFLKHDPRRGVVVAKKPDQFAVVVHGDPFGNEVLLDHVNEILRLPHIGTRIGLPVRPG